MTQSSLHCCLWRFGGLVLSLPLQHGMEDRSGSIDFRWAFHSRYSRKIGWSIHGAQWHFFFSSEWFSATIRKALIARCFSPLGETCCLSIQNRWFRLRRTVFSFFRSVDRQRSDVLAVLNISSGKACGSQASRQSVATTRRFCFLSFLRYTIRIREHTYDGTFA